MSTAPWEIAELNTAADFLDAMQRIAFNVSNNWTPLIHQIRGPLATMLRDTAKEYAADEVGRYPAVICQHCWDLVNLALIVNGKEPVTFYEDADD